MSIDIAKDIVKITENIMLTDELNTLEKKKFKLFKNTIIVELYYTYIPDYDNNEYSSELAIYRFANINEGIENKKILYWILKHDTALNNYAIVNIQDNYDFIEKIIADLEVSFDIHSNEFARRNKFIVKIRIPSQDIENNPFGIHVCCHIEEYDKYTTLKRLINETINFIKNIQLI